MKRVVFKVNNFPTMSETFVVNNIVAAIEKGFDVRIITNRIGSLQDSSQPNLFKEYNLLQKTYAYRSPKALWKRLLDFFYLIFNPVLSYFFIKYIFNEKKIKIEYMYKLKSYLPYRNAVFHVHFATAIGPLLELKEIGFIKSKIVLTSHGYDVFKLKTEDFRKKNLVSRIQKNISIYTVNSNYLKQELLSIGFDPEMIKIIPIGFDEKFINLNKISEEQPLNPLRIITVARLVKIKGIEFGLRTIKKLIDKNHQVFYTIVGDGVEADSLKSLAKELQIENHVKFMGSKSQDEIKNIFKSQDVFLMTSTYDQDGRREAFGVVSLEAQASGLPVVGFNSGGFPETIMDGKTGFIVLDRDVDAMVAVIEKFINDKDLFYKMKKHSMNHVIDNFSPAQTTLKYLEWYN